MLFGLLNGVAREGLLNGGAREGLLNAGGAFEGLLDGGGAFEGLLNVFSLLLFARTAFGDLSSTSVFTAEGAFARVWGDGRDEVSRALSTTLFAWALACSSFATLTWYAILPNISYVVWFNSTRRSAFLESACVFLGSGLNSTTFAICAFTLSNIPLHFLISSELRFALESIAHTKWGGPSMIRKWLRNIIFLYVEYCPAVLMDHHDILTLNDDSMVKK